MRPIEFRAWDKEKKIMISDFDQSWAEEYKLKLGSSLHNTVYRIGFFYGTLMQFTGLLDKNGKNIFEGDLLKCSYYGDWIGRVYWGEDTGQWWWDDHVLFELTNFEIIGNIHQHPELLEAK